ncbi:MAG: c-type cytochrome [Microthrixaceae bacterium]
MQRRPTLPRLIIFSTLVGIAFGPLLTGCGGSDAPEQKTTPAATPEPAAAEQPAAPPAFPGAITAADLRGPVDKAMAQKGATTYNVKCQSCHTLTDKRVVGPGWQGVLTRREPVWVMNMIMHTDAMLSADTTAQRMLEECLVRMPNQNLTKDEAREVLELMRTI